MCDCTMKIFILKEAQFTLFGWHNVIMWVTLNWQTGHIYLPIFVIRCNSSNKWTSNAQIIKGIPLDVTIFEALTFITLLYVYIYVFCIGYIFFHSHLIGEHVIMIFVLQKANKWSTKPTKINAFNEFLFISLGKKYKRVQKVQKVEEFSIQIRKCKEDPDTQVHIKCSSGLWLNHW